MNYTMKNTLRPGSIALGLGLMLTTLCQAQVWSNEASLGGYFWGTPAVAQIPGSNVIQVFYEGLDKALWTVWRNPDGVWSSEQRLGGQPYTGVCGAQGYGDDPQGNCLGFNITPVAIQIPNTNYLEVFYMGQDFTLRYLLRDNNGNWSPEGNLGGHMGGNPAAVQVPGTDQIQVFYRGSDGNLKTQWGNLNSWVYEQDMGGQLFGPNCSDVTNDSCYGAFATPALTQLPGTNFLEVFYRAPDNTLRYRLRDNTGNWQPEGYLGGHLSSDPSAGPIPGTNVIEVYYRGAGPVDGSLMTQWGNLGSWAYETPVQGETLSGYACYSYNPARTCLVSYSAPKAYATANDLLVFFRGPSLPAQIGVYSTVQQTVTHLNASTPITDPMAVTIPGTNTIQMFFADKAYPPTDFNIDSYGYLATRWYPY